DHLTSWADGDAERPGGGCTCPRNGGPGCGKHNRFKYRHRYTAHRDPDGTWHVHRPDGTPID
ncbi:MAG: endonuclease, partial [Acidimicrobiales bacterium]|nr:endonuclease [Acidimicrobiales bacterium]